MIQRIQSIFLFLASGACFGLFGLPIAETDQARPQGFFTDADFDVYDHWSLLATFAAAGLVSLVAIFLYNNRPAQLKLALVAIVLVLTGCVISGIFLSQDTATAAAQVTFGSALPVLAIAFAILARRGIAKDEKLVRSADRLR
jgi:peptidoglycan/LPS O-acetylase OafA/YrhL